MVMWRRPRRTVTHAIAPRAQQPRAATRRLAALVRMRRMAGGAVANAPPVSIYRTVKLSAAIPGPQPRPQGERTKARKYLNLQSPLVFRQLQDKKRQHFQQLAGFDALAPAQNFPLGPH
jgi:hypothetical protein